MKRSVEELLEMPYWIADILPEQVKSNSAGQYFSVERYLMREPRRTEIKRRHAELVLKLNCYYGVSMDDEAEMNPPPERIEETILSRYVCVLLGDSLIVSDPDDTNLTIYNPDERLLSLLDKLCTGAGLFLWQPESGKQGGT
jgi:hypothetical protein